VAWARPDGSGHDSAALRHSPGWKRGYGSPNSI